MNGDLVERVAVALRDRVAAQRRAEERIASFAFTEGRAPDTPDPGTSGDLTAGDWCYFAGRALRLAGEPWTLQLLEALRAGGRSIDEIAASGGPGPHDRLAAADWVGGLASAGLVARELESGRISLTPLGEALRDLVAEIARRADAGAS